MQTALKYDIDVIQPGRIELPVPFSIWTRLTIFVLPEEESTDKSKPTTKELVAELYASDKITFKQAQHLLNHNNWQDTVTVLKQQGCELYYDEDDFEEDLETLVLFNETGNSS